MSDALYVIQQVLLITAILGFFVVLGLLGSWLRDFYRDIGWIRDKPWPKRRGQRESSPDLTQESSREDHL
jgi:hypothetical protein